MLNRKLSCVGIALMLALSLLLGACGAISAEVGAQSQPSPAANTPALILYSDFKQLDSYNLTASVGGKDLKLSAKATPEEDYAGVEMLWSCNDTEALRLDVSEDSRVCAVKVNPRLTESRFVTITVSCGDLSRTLDVNVEAGDAAAIATVEVDSVDELINSLASNTRILLKPGTYDLTTASDYGKSYNNGSYTWVDCFDGYTLNIRGVKNLYIGASDGDAEGVSIVTVPRCADVLSFTDCAAVNVENLTVGHTEMSGACEGEVIQLLNSFDILISGCRLYGCGTIGIFASGIDNLSVSDTEIYECSSEGIYASNCENLYVSGCEIHDCGCRTEGGAFSMISLSSCVDAVLSDCSVYDNRSYGIVTIFNSDTVRFTDCAFRDNHSSHSFFDIMGPAPRFENCVFEGNSGRFFKDSATNYIFDGSFNKINEQDLGGAEFAEEYESPAEMDMEDIPTVKGRDVHVTTADEFLAAIAPDTNIYIDAELIDLTEAEGYGVDSENYHWEEVFDGCCLVIDDVDNLSIIGKGRFDTTVQTTPRYADVLRFRKCDNVTVAKLTVGHSPEPSICSGDVLAFIRCSDFKVYDCGLFGCGVYGIRSEVCDDGDVRSTEIYDCQCGAAHLCYSDNIVFTDCLVRDCNYGNDNLIYSEDCEGCVYNGRSLSANGADYVG